MTRLVLPQPPKTYTPQTEGVRNREIERLVNEKVSQVDLAAELAAIRVILDDFETRIAALEGP